MPVALRIEYSVGNAQGEQAIQTLSAVLDRADAELKDFGRWVFPRVIPALEEASKEQFAAEGFGPVVGHWAPLSVSYAKVKEARYPGKPILEPSGAMREALTSTSSPWAAREYSASDLAFGTQGLHYASFHQVGGVRLPARPPFDFGPSVDEKLVKAAQLGMVDGLREAARDDAEVRE